MRQSLFTFLLLLCLSFSFNSYASEKVYSKAFDGFVNIREKASGNSAVVGKFFNGPDGAEFISETEDGVWSYIKYKESIGYVNTEYIQRKPTIKYTGSVDANWISGCWSDGHYGLVIFNNGTWYLSYEYDGIYGRYIMQNEEVRFKTISNPFNLSEFNETLEIKTAEAMLGNFCRVDFITEEAEGTDWPIMTKETYSSLRKEVSSELKKSGNNDVIWESDNTGNITPEDDSMFEEKGSIIPLVKKVLKWVLVGIGILGACALLIVLIKKAFAKIKNSIPDAKNAIQGKRVELSEKATQLNESLKEKSNILISKAKEESPINLKKLTITSLLIYLFLDNKLGLILLLTSFILFIIKLVNSSLITKAFQNLSSLVNKFNQKPEIWIILCGLVIYRELNAFCGIVATLIGIIYLFHKKDSHIKKALYSSFEKISSDAQSNPLYAFFWALIVLAFLLLNYFFLDILQYLALILFICFIVYCIKPSIFKKSAVWISEQYTNLPQSSILKKTESIAQSKWKIAIYIFIGLIVTFSARQNAMIFMAPDMFVKETKNSKGGNMDVSTSVEIKNFAKPKTEVELLRERRSEIKKRMDEIHHRMINPSYFGETQRLKEEFDYYSEQFDAISEELFRRTGSLW